MAEFYVKTHWQFCKARAMTGGRNRAVGIAPSYGMDGPGLKPFFLTRPDWPPDPLTQPRVQWVLGLFSDSEVAEAWNLHPPYPVPKIKNEQSCSFTPLLGIYGLFYGELYISYQFACHDLNVVLGEATDYLTNLPIWCLMGSVLSVCGLI